MRSERRKHTLCFLLVVFVAGCLAAGGLGVRHGQISLEDLVVSRLEIFLLVTEFVRD